MMNWSFLPDICDGKIVVEIWWRKFLDLGEGKVCSFFTQRSAAAMISFGQHQSRTPVELKMIYYALNCLCCFVSHKVIAW